MNSLEVAFEHGTLRTIKQREIEHKYYTGVYLDQDIQTKKYFVSYDEVLQFETEFLEDAEEFYYFSI